MAMKFGDLKCGFTKRVARQLPGLKLCRIAWIFGCGVSQCVLALPQGGDVTAGNATLNVDANQLTVNQTSDRVIIDYQSFDIKADERVQFIQPSNSSVALNRVVGNNLSAIDGQIQANGQVFLINPNGVVFGQGARVDVGGLLVSTLPLGNTPFLEGRLELKAAAGSDAGGIKNYGALGAAQGVYLVAPELVNDGTIDAKEVAMVSGHAVLVQPQGSKIAVLLQGPDALGSLQQTGAINAQRALLAVQSGVHGAQLHNDGLLRATAATLVDGSIELLAPKADVLQSGALVAGSGSVSVKADRYAQTGSINVDGAGAADAGDVAIHTRNALVVHPNASVKANADVSGDGGQVILYSANATAYRSDAKISARGGSVSGDGGFVEVSGLEYIDVQGTVDVGANNGQAGLWYIDPSNITINDGGVNEDSFVGSDPYVWSLRGAKNARDAQYAQIDIDTLLNTLNNQGDVVISTTSDRALDGDITIAVDIPLNEVPSGRYMTLNADNDILFDEGVDIRGTALSGRAFDLTLNANRDIDFGNNNRIHVGQGSFSAVAGRNIEVGDITSNNAASDTAISLVAGGAILEDGLNTTGMRGSGGMLLSAVTGIGANGSLTLATDRLALALNGPFDFRSNARREVVLTGIGLVSGATVVFNGSKSIRYSGSLGSELDGAVDSSITLNSTGGSIFLDGDLSDTKGTINNATAMNFSAFGGVIMSDGASVNAGDAKLSITAGSGVSALTGLTSLSDANDAIGLNINGGKLTDPGDANPIDINAPNGGVNFKVQGDIVDLEVAAGIMDVVSRTGSAVINGLGDVTIAGLDTAGASSISAVKDLFVSNTATIAVAGLSLVAGGTLGVPDGGLSTAGPLSLTSSELVSQSGGRTVSLAAADIRLQTRANGDTVTLNTNTDSLDLTMLGSANTVVTNEGPLTLSSINVAADLTLNLASGDLRVLQPLPVIGGETTTINLAAGDLRVNDQGLTLSNDLVLTATGVRDSNNQAVIRADDAILTILNSVEDLDIAVDFDLLSLDAQGAQTVSITDTDDLEIAYVAAAADLNLTSTESALVIFDSVAQFVGNLSFTGLDGDVVLPEAGLSTEGDLAVTASGLSSVDGGAVTINARAASLQLTDATAVTLDGNIAQLGLSASSATDISMINRQNLAVTQWQAPAANRIAFEVAGGLRLLPEGLTSTSAISVLAHDVSGDDGALVFNTRDLLLDLSAPTGDIALTTQVQNLDARIAGKASLTVNQTGDLTLMSLGASGQAVAVENGNFGLNLSDGNLVVEGDISAADLTADGIREGVISLAVDNGNLTVGERNSVVIRSNNGLNPAPTSNSIQSGLQLQLSGRGAQAQALTLGSGNNSVVIDVKGGDINIDLRADELATDTPRNFVNNEGVAMAAYNRAGEPSTGVVLVNGVAVTPDASLKVGPGRRFHLQASYQFPEPEPKPEVTPASDNTDYLGSIEPRVETGIELEVDTSQVQLDAQFAQVFGRCSEADQARENPCRINTALKAFLSRWLVGGDLPPKTEI